MRHVAIADDMLLIRADALWRAVAAFWATTSGLSVLLRKHRVIGVILKCVSNRIQIGIVNIFSWLNAVCETARNIVHERQRAFTIATSD